MQAYNWPRKHTEKHGIITNKADTRAIRAFNEALYRDTRVDISLIPIADGLTLATNRI
jgi:predicted O-methyltransferase YrrM